MDVMKLLKKASVNEYSSCFADGTIFDITGYYDSGNYLLNAQLSGDLFKGIPCNKKIGYSGFSKTGKTFIALLNLKSFLDQSENNYAIWFASENAVSKDMLLERNIDISRVHFEGIDTVENFNKCVWEHLKQAEIIKKNNSNIKFMYLLDSLGQLSSGKEISEMDKEVDKQKEDMTRAKKIKKLFRTLELKLASLNIPLILTNHVYQKTDCLTEDNYVKTSKGIKSIKDINKNDKVKTLFGFKRVSRKVEYDIEEYIEIKLENNQIIKCTEDHKFMIENNGEIGWKKAGELDNNDEILSI